MIDPEAWAREQEQRTAELLQRAERAKADLAAAAVTATSTAQLVTVSVNPGGALLDLQFSARAMQLTSAQLAALVLETYRTACAEASRRMLGIMAELVGPDSSAMDLLRDTIPSPDTGELGENAPGAAGDPRRRGETETDR